VILVLVGNSLEALHLERKNLTLKERAEQERKFSEVLTKHCTEEEKHFVIEKIWF
jgi:hypothetical protein